MHKIFSNNIDSEFSLIQQEKNRKMPNQKSTLQLIVLIALTLPSLFGVGSAYAFSPEHYAASSALSKGQWAKIEVTETGMQFISDATIRALGFSDPEHVNVYGYGGVMIPETLASPDDLPPVGALRVNGGIIFFGKANVGWTINPSGETLYSHISHPYSDVSYYFLSDSGSPAEVADSPVYSAYGKPITSFTERIVHEQDLFMPMDTGRLMLGEDFRSQSNRTFNFILTGNQGDATVKTAFGCKSTGNASIVLSANGKQLPATSSDQMDYSSTKLIVTTYTIKEVEDPGTSLDLAIKFNGGGVVSQAGLDYIEIEYPRSLEMTAGDLYFYISPSSASEVKVKGASSSTVVWDISNPTAPLKMAATVNGSELSFVSDSGYHEYVAFDPARISRPVLPSIKVDNQDIHSMEAPDMLVICPEEYLSAAQRLSNLHAQTDGLTLGILTPETIYNEFSSGKPDVSAFRKLLKMWYDRAKAGEGDYPRYCLIMSRPTYDNKQITPLVKNAGYPRVPIWQSITGETHTTSYSTDDYIGMLEDVAETFNIGTSEIHVAVARMPFKSISEANTVLDKLEDYILRPDLGAWRTNIMVIADDQDGGVHLDQAEKVINAMYEEELASRYLFEKLYLDAYKLEYTGVGASYPQAHERLINKWNEGLAYIDYIGHANAREWGHENLFTWTDIQSMSNSRLPFLYAATCEFMKWDDDETSGAEILWLMPNSGVIGMICPSREVLISANGVLNRITAKHVFAKGEDGLPLSVGEIMRRGKNESNTGTNKLRYGLMGDPTLKLPWPTLKVVVDEINGIDLQSTEELPVLPARSKVTLSGHLEDAEGNLVDNFNGIAELAVYDAEKVITTNANGDEGVVSEYNDRKTRLFVGRTKVNDGKWTTNFTMPSEIDNNYSPALITMYAYNEEGEEANGACDQLYAYGYDETAPEDFEGPKMIEFYINHPGFNSGDEVSPNPVLTAKFTDPSGISVSEAGIGHNITLCLDGKTYFDDVAQYYIPDEIDPGAGTLTYALGEVGQGEHNLTLIVWDNANNSTTATLNFSISALWKPTIETLATDVNPATSGVNFIVATDGALSSMECAIEVYDIWGRKVWRDTAPSLSGSTPRTTLAWNLCDFSGSRIPGGVYLYRATVKTNTGATVTKTKKLMVVGQ